MSINYLERSAILRSMTKRIKVQSINEEIVTHPKRLREVTSDEVEDADKRIAPINRLGLDLLVKIFEWLTPHDRLQARLICKNWNKAAEHCWSNLRSFYFVPSTMQVSEMISILKRGGRFVQRLSLRTSSTHCSDQKQISEALRYTPNLKHLSLYLQDESYVLREVNKLNLSDKLKSFAVTFDKSKPKLMPLNTLLSNCYQLEALKLGKTSGYKIDLLPSTLKYFQETGDVDCAQIMEVVVKQKIALRGLKLSCDVSYRVPYFFLLNIDCTKLEHLSISLCEVTWPSFKAVSVQLMQLVSLELKPVQFADNTLYVEAVSDIVKNFKLLQKLRICFGAGLSSNALDLLADLKQLTHVSVNATESEPVANLFAALSKQRKLQYFATNRTLSGKSVREALLSCESLLRIYSFSPRAMFAVKICEALDQIFGKGTSPNSCKDPNIRHFYFGLHGWEGQPKHPWAIFHDSPSGFGWDTFSNFEIY